MEDIAKRIKELIDYKGISNKDFADSIGVAPAIISHVLSGRNNPSLNLIQQITNVYTNVNLDYILNGKGELIEKESVRIEPKQEVKTESHQLGFNQLPPGTRLVSEPSGAPIPQKTPLTEEPSPKPEAVTPVKPPTPADELTNVYTNVNSSDSKEIERIIVFYKDRSFREYRPEA